MQLRHPIVTTATVSLSKSKFTRRPATKEPLPSFLKSLLASLFPQRMVDHPPPPLSLATRLRANYTEERKRSDGRKEERLRHPTHVTVSIAHYLRSIEHNTATLLPLSLSFLASTHIGPARKRAPAVLLSLRLCPETMNKRKKGGREGEGGKVAGTVNVLENEKKKKKIVYKYRGR